MKHTWNRVKSSMPNLNVLMVGDREVGFVYKPKDTKTDKNAWRVYLGIGDDNKFLGHAWSMVNAKRLLESVAIGGVRGYNY